MKRLSRNFTTKEKILIAVLLLILVFFLYYKFVHLEVTEGLSKAAKDKEDYSLELETANMKIAQYEKMSKEMDQVIKDGLLSPMPTYNNGKNVTDLFNDVVGDPDRNFVIRFSNLTRKGNLVRRIISFQFDAKSHEEVASVFFKLTESDYRCMVSDIKYSAKYENNNGETAVSIRVNATITFYETLVGGTPDAELPAVKKTQTQPEES